MAEILVLKGRGYLPTTLKNLLKKETLEPSEFFKVLSDPVRCLYSKDLVTDLKHFTIIPYGGCPIVEGYPLPKYPNKFVKKIYYVNNFYVLHLINLENVLEN